MLKNNGAKKKDRICLYMPMVPELAIAVLACARIGAIHSVVFAGFSAKSLSDRINDADCNILITADGGFRKGKLIKLKDIVDEAVSHVSSVEHVIVFRRAHNDISLNDKDCIWSDLMDKASDDCDAEKLESTHPIYILYTSGTKPLIVML